MKHATTTVQFHITNQASDHDTTAYYYADVAKHFDLCRRITVTDTDEPGILLTGSTHDIDTLEELLPALLRHDQYGEDTRQVQFVFRRLDS